MDWWMDDLYHGPVSKGRVYLVHESGYCWIGVWTPANVKINLIWVVNICQCVCSQSRRVRYFPALSYVSLKMQICAPDTSTSQSALKCRPLPAALLISKPTEWHRETVVLFHPNQPCWTLCQHCSQRVVSGSCHTCSVCRRVKSAPRTTTEATNNIVLCTLSFILLWSASTKCSGYNCRGTFYFFWSHLCIFFCCKSRAMALGIWPSVFIQCLKINAHAQSLWCNYLG